VRSRERFVRQEPKAILDQLPHRRPNIGDSEADVMETRSASLEVAGDRRRFIGRLQELNPGVADRKKRDPNLLILDLLDAFDLETQRTVNGESGVE
jgi:hypothetical protein